MNRRMQRLMPLVRHQFRYLKWVLLFNAVLAVACGFVLFDMQNSAVTDWIWGYGMLHSSSQRGLMDTFASPLWSITLFYGIVTACMALIQQGRAYASRRARFMAALPYTRGERLGAMAFSGMLIYTLPLILFGALSLLVYANRPEVIDIAIKVSPVQKELARQNTAFTIIVPVFKSWLILTSLYTFVLLIGHMFGNVVVTVGFLGALGSFFAVFLSHPYIYENTIRFLFGNRGWEAFMYARAERLAFFVIPMLSYVPVPGGLPLTMPWDGLMGFTMVHMVFTAACFGDCMLAARKLHIEDLGGIFLFQASRYIVAAYIILWPLLLPLMNLATYDWRLDRYVYDPYFPLSFIPAGLTFLAIRFVMRRKGRARRPRAVAVVLIAAVLMGLAGWGSQGAAAEAAHGSQEAVLEAQIALERMRFDVEGARKVVELLNALEDAVDMKEEDDFYLFSEYDDGRFSEGILDVIERIESGQEFTYEQYAFIRNRFERYFSYNISISGDDERCQTVQEALTRLGYPALAQGVQAILREGEDGEEKNYYENGVWMCGYLMEERYMDWDESEEEYVEKIYLELFVNTPVTLTAHETLLAKLDDDPNLQRHLAFSNGEYDIIEYRIAGGNGRRGFSYEDMLQLIFRSDVFEHLFLQLNSFDVENEADRDTAKNMVKTALAEVAKLSEEDAGRIAVDIAGCWERGKDGSGSLGNITWRIDCMRGFWSSPHYRLHIEMR